MNIQDIIVFKNHKIILFQYNPSIVKANVVAVDIDGKELWRSKKRDGLCRGMVQINESRFQLIYDDRYIIYYIENGKIREDVRKYIRRRKIKSYGERKRAVLKKFFG